MKQQYENKRNIQDYRLLALSARKACKSNYSILTSEEITEALELTPLQTARLLTRLMTQGRIGKLRRKLYIFPDKLPPGKVWKPSAYLAIASYMDWLGATWQITGLEALSRYGYSTQILQKITLYNDQISGEREVAGNQFYFIKVPKSRLGSVHSFVLDGTSGLQLVYSSKARTLFDAVYESRFKFLSQALKWISSEKDNPQFLSELIDCSLKFGNQITCQRIGWLLSNLGEENKKLKKLKAKLGDNPSLVTVVLGARSGTIDKEWNVIENISFESLLPKD